MVKLLRLFIIAVIVALWLPVYAFAQDAEYTVDYKITGNWSTGFCADLIVKNTGTIPIEGWELEFYFTERQQISSLWNGQYVQQGNKVVVKNAGWNKIISPGQAVSVGFTAVHDGENSIPEKFSLNEVRSNEPGGEDQQPDDENDGTGSTVGNNPGQDDEQGDVDQEQPYKIDYRNTSDWGSGFGANITITNEGTASLEDWTLEFIFPNEQKINSLWNGSFTQQQNKVIVEPAHWNKSITPGQSIQIGFTAGYQNENDTVARFMLNGATVIPETDGNQADGEGETNPAGDTTGSGGGEETNPGETEPHSSLPDYSLVDAGEGKLWPEQVFAPFVDATLWPIYQLADEVEKNNVRYYTLGFIVAKSPTDGTPTWGTYYEAEEGPRQNQSRPASSDPTSMQMQIKKLRQNGGDIMVSFGGAANTPVAAAIKDVNELKEQYKQFIKAYRLTHIDFDIEGLWVADKESIDRRSRAIALLQDELKNENYPLQVWYTLPVLPSGLTGDGMYVLRSALNQGVKLAGVNIMAMDYGDAEAPNPQNQMGEYAIEAATNLYSQLKSLFNEFNVSKTDRQLWNMVGVTPMIGLNDVTTEIFNQQDAEELLSFAKERGIGLLSMWSIARDKAAPSGEPVSYVSTSHSSITQYPYEFSHIFSLYTN